MNLRSCKALKSFSILLLSLEFLAPAVIGDLFPDGRSDECQQGVLHVNKQKSQIFFFNETDKEEDQRDDHYETCVPPAQGIHIPICVRFINRKSGFSVAALAGDCFDTHPPLFTLHCLLLI
jgi:hypothetical protein